MENRLTKLIDESSDIPEEQQHKENLPMFAGRQIIFMIFFVFNINKVQEHTMNLTDLLQVELSNDNLEFVHRTWREESLRPLGSQH